MVQRDTLDHRDDAFFQTLFIKLSLCAKHYSKLSGCDKDAIYGT